MTSKTFESQSQLGWLSSSRASLSVKFLLLATFVCAAAAIGQGGLQFHNTTAALEERLLQEDVDFTCELTGSAQDIGRCTRKKARKIKRGLQKSSESGALGSLLLREMYVAPLGAVPRGTAALAKIVDGLFDRIIGDTETAMEKAETLHEFTKNAKPKAMSREHAGECLVVRQSTPGFTCTCCIAPSLYAHNWCFALVDTPEDDLVLDSWYPVSERAYDLVRKSPSDDPVTFYNKCRELGPEWNV